MYLDMAITIWEQHLARQTGLAATTIIQYVRDARRFAAWLADHAPASTLADVTTAMPATTATRSSPLAVLPPPSTVR